MRLRGAAALVALLCTAAEASPLVGMGRVTLAGGWRLTPNGRFLDSLSAKGLTPLPGPGGPLVTGTFGYSATDYFELAIDLIGSAEQLGIRDAPPVTTITYGAWLGGRLQWQFPAPGAVQQVIPFIGLQAGPTLVFATGGPGGAREEVLTQAYAVSAGATALFGALGITLEARYVITSGTLAPFGTFNAGGFWTGLGFTWTVPAAAAEPGSVRF